MHFGHTCGIIINDAVESLYWSNTIQPPYLIKVFGITLDSRYTTWWQRQDRSPNFRVKSKHTNIADMYACKVTSAVDVRSIGEI